MNGPPLGRTEKENGVLRESPNTERQTTHVESQYHQTILMMQIRLKFEHNQDIRLWFALKELQFLHLVVDLFSFPNSHNDLIGGELQGFAKNLQEG